MNKGVTSDEFNEIQISEIQNHGSAAGRPSFWVPPPPYSASCMARTAHAVTCDCTPEGGEKGFDTLMMMTKSLPIALIWKYKEFPYHWHWVAGY